MGSAAGSVPLGCQHGLRWHAPARSLSGTEGPGLGVSRPPEAPCPGAWPQAAALRCPRDHARGLALWPGPHQAPEDRNFLSHVGGQNPLSGSGTAVRVSIRPHSQQELWGGSRSLGATPPSCHLLPPVCVESSAPSYEAPEMAFRALGESETSPRIQNRKRCRHLRGTSPVTCSGSRGPRLAPLSHHAAALPWCHCSLLGLLTSNRFLSPSALWASVSLVIKGISLLRGRCPRLSTQGHPAAEPGSPPGAARATSPGHRLWGASRPSTRRAPVVANSRAPPLSALRAGSLSAAQAW